MLNSRVEHKIKVTIILIKEIRKTSPFIIDIFFIHFVIAQNQFIIIKKFFLHANFYLNNKI
jgi:hypothetical protein